MLYSIAVLVLCSLSVVRAGIFTNDQKELIVNTMHECMEETKVDMEILKKAQVGEYVDDENLKKQLFCFNKKVGLQNDEGDIQMDVITPYLENIITDPVERGEAVTKCLVRTGSGEETAFFMMKCLHEFVSNIDILS